MKFLRGKVWKIILAVCLLAVLLCVTASAAEAGSVAIQFADQTVTVDHTEDKYFFTDENGLLVTTKGDVTASSEAYNVMLSVDGTTAQMKLNGATIKNGTSDYAMNILTEGTTVSSLRVIVEDDSSVISTKNAIRVNTARFYVNGPSKLSVVAEEIAFHVISGGLSVEQTGDLYTKSNLVTNAQGGSVYSISFSKDININGGKATFEGGHTTLVSFTGGKINLTDNADVTINGGTGGCSYVTAINVTNSRLYTTKRFSSNGNQKTTFTYDGNYVIKFGGEAKEAGEYTGDLNSTSVLAAPAYKATINGTEKYVGIGETVSLSAAATSGDQSFARWTTTSEDVAFADHFMANTTFVMPNHDVVVTANYGVTGKIGIMTSTISVVQGGPAKYYTTTDSGTLSDLSSGTTEEKEAGYEIKVEFPAGTESALMVYFRGAYLKRTDGGYMITGASGMAKTVFVSQEYDGEIAAANDETVDNYLYGCMNVTVPLEFQGDSGKLRIEYDRSGVISTSKTITFTSGNVDLICTKTTNAGCIGGTPQKIIFNGGNTYIEAAYVGIFVTSGGDAIEGVEVNNSAKVHIKATGNDAVHLVNYSSPKVPLSNAALVVNGGSIKIETTKSGNTAWRSDCDRIEVNGGALTLSSLGKAAYSGKPTLTNYKNAVTGVTGANAYYAILGSDANAGVYDGSAVLSSYKYFSVAPAYTVTVNGGTASLQKPNGTLVSTSKVPEGATVQLTASGSSGKVFTKWIVDQNSAKIEDLTNDTVTPTTFTMPAGNVIVRAQYNAYATIILGDLTAEDCTFSDESPKYFLTDESGVITELTEGDQSYKEKNYNVKLGFDEETHIPTVYLKRAYIAAANTAIQNGTGTSEFAIETLVVANKITAGDHSVDSYITHGNAESSTGTAVETSGKVTFRGAGWLKTQGVSITSKSINSTSGGTQDVVFDGANVLIYREGTGYGQAALTGSPKEIVFTNNAKVTVNAKYAAVFSPGIKVENGANVTLIGGSAGHQTVYSTSKNITVTGGKLRIEGSRGDMIAVAAINVTGGTYEVITSSGTLNAAPTYTNYVGAYALSGSSKAAATVYTGGTLSKYFIVGKGETVTVEGGTAKAFGVTSAADPDDETKQKLTAIVGETVTLIPAEASAGSLFAGWSFVGTSLQPTITDNTFTMPDGSVSVISNYGKQAGLTIRGTAYKVAQGGEALYFKTNTSGQQSPLNGEVAYKEANYNIKLVYPTGDNAKLTLYLRDAYIAASVYSIQGDTSSPADTLFVIQQSANRKVTVGSGTKDADAYMTGVIEWRKGNLEIQGPGKLMIEAGYNAINNAGYLLTFNGVDLDLKTTANSSAECVKAKRLTFNGGTASLQANTSGPAYMSWDNTTNEGIRIENGADVTMHSNGHSAILINAGSTNAQVIVNSGKLKLTTNSTQAIRCERSGSFVINGGTVELSGTTAAGYTGTTPVLSGYTNANSGVTGSAGYYAIAGNDENASAYGGGSLEDYKYFKLVPAYAINVTNGTAKMEKPDGSFVATTKAPEGVTVELTADVTKAFINWKVGLDSEQKPVVTLADVTSATTTFTMGTKVVSVEAIVEKLANIKLSGTNYLFTESTAVYFTTEDSVLAEITGENLETRYNVKLAFDEETGIPTIYLRGASIVAEENAIENGDYTPEFAIHTQTESSIQQTKASQPKGRDCVLLRTSGKVIFCGEGKLSLNAKDNAIYGTDANAELEFDNADVLMTTADGEYGQGGIVGSLKNLHIKNSKVHFNTNYMVMMVAPTITVDGEKSDVRFVSERSIVVWGAANITVNNGNFYAEGGGNGDGEFTGYPAFWLVNSITVNGGTFEAYHPGDNTGTNDNGADVFGKAPVLSGYAGHLAVVGTSKANATVYNATSGEALTMKYFKVAPAYTVTVDEGKGTATAYGVTGTSVNTFAGDQVTIEAAPEAGYGLAYWTSNAWSGSVYEPTYAFTVPAEAANKTVTVAATYGLAADVKIGNTVYTAVQGGKILYYTTSNSGNVAGEAAEGTYHIKFEYPANETIDDVEVVKTPILHLRGAHIYNTITNGTNTASKMTIIVEHSENRKVTVDDSTENYDVYIRDNIRWENCPLEIIGENKDDSLANLWLKCSVSVTGNSLTFKDLNLKMNTGTGFGGSPTEIIFSGGTADIDTTFLGTNVGADVTITFTNNTNVNWVSANMVFYNDQTLGSKVVMESGYLYAEALTDGKPVTQNFAVEISGGTLEFYSPQYVGGFIPVVKNYSDPAGTTYCAAYGQKKDGTGLSPLQENYGGTNFKYLKIEPAYKITIEKGYSNNWTSWPAGKPVTVSATCTIADAGTGLQHWYTDDVDGETYNDEFIKFTMPEKDVTIKPAYGDLAQVQVTGTETVSAVEGGATRYYKFVEKNDGTIIIQKIAVYPGATQEPEYNFKFAYATDGTPTLTLKNVVRETDGRIHCGADTPELIVALEGENSLKNTTSDGRAEVVRFVGNNLTFTGDGTLKLQSSYRVIWMERTGLDPNIGTDSSLTFDHVSMELITTGHWQMCVDASGGTSVAVNGGDLYMQGVAFVDSQAKPGSTAFYNGKLLTITDDAVITIPVMNIAVSMPVEMESGTLIIGKDVMDSTGENVLVTGNVRIGFGSSVAVNGGTVEVVATEKASENPVNCTDYVDSQGNRLYSAAIADSRADFEADPENSVYTSGDSTGSKKYLLIEPKMVTVTITWGVMSFTYTGAEWNVETLKWEGKWEPSNTVAANGMQGNQIQVENTGTEIVYVSFAFQQEQSFTACSEITTKFLNNADPAVGAELADNYQLNRFRNVNAFVNLDSGAASGQFDDNAMLGTIVITIRADGLPVQVETVAPTQGGNA